MGERLRMREAARRALDDEMAADGDVVVLGEDVAVAGGPFKVTDGLLDKYGERRVIDTPISEAGFLGAAVGAAGPGPGPPPAPAHADSAHGSVSHLVARTPTPSNARTPGGSGFSAPQ